MEDTCVWYSNSNIEKHLKLIILPRITHKCFIKYLELEKTEENTAMIEKKNEPAYGLSDHHARECEG